MAQRSIELSRDGEPVRVYHHYASNCWTHPFLEACDLCRKGGWTVAVRRTMQRRIRALYQGV